MQKKLTAQEILETLAGLRKSLPGIEAAPRPDHDHDGRSMLPDGFPAETEQDFEDAAVIDALQSLIGDVEAIVRKKEARLLEDALKIYYITEEPARDPANAHLIPHVEKMRRAYEREFGEPIPPKK